MAEILGAATAATKYFLEDQVTIDNGTFKLFYKITTTLLLACSVVTCSKQFFGDPINCEVVRIFHVSKMSLLVQKIVLSLFLLSSFLALHLLLCASSTKSLK